jgi:hypothetical protein
MSETPPPEPVHELADACIGYVSRALGVALDYTPDTLPVLDHYLRSIPDSAAAEVLALIAPAAGAYFGEVVRRSLGTGARWHCPPEDHAAWRLELGPVHLSFNPIGAALEAARRDEVEGWGAHFQVRDLDRAVLEEALSRTEPVAADDFHRLAVRYDALEHVVDLLSSRAAARRREAN